MRRLRFHGNTTEWNIYEFVGFVGDTIACLPLNPHSKEDFGKLTIFGVREVVFLDSDPASVEYNSNINSFLKEEDIKARLLKYDYIKYAQGTPDRGSEYAFIYAPKDASFNNVRSRLIKERYKENEHEIILESVVDLTIDS